MILKKINAKKEQINESITIITHEKEITIDEI